jgi:histidyl-tRNA synthetase
MFQSVRGTFDVLPDAQGDRSDPSGGPFIPGSAAWREAERVVCEVLARFGFEEIRTPVLEPLGLIARGVGQTTDIVQKEMFVVRREDEDYVLRPEVTAPVMRAYLEHRLDQRGGTQRLYYVGPCFRAERPQKGRFRQFHQFGVELLGSDAPAADAEAVVCLRAVYDAFGVTETRLRLNTLGGAEARAAYRDALRAYFAPHRDRLSETSRQRLETNPLRILDTKEAHEQALLADAPRLADFLSDADRARFGAFKRLLDDLGVPYAEDPLLVRGLDYYTGVVFELESDRLGAQRALAAGGRYDGLAEMVGGRVPVPAVGWAAGFERLFLALQAAGYPFAETPRPDAFLVALGEEAQRWAFAEAQRLRAAGLAVASDLQGRSMKAQMKEADRQRARFAVLVGSDELAAGAAAVRDLDTSAQRQVPFDELVAALEAGKSEG